MQQICIRDVCEIIKAINLNDMNNESLTLIDNIIKSINHLITRQLLHSFQKIVFALGSKGIYDENIRQMFHFKIRTFQFSNFKEVNFQDLLRTFSLSSYYHSNNIELYMIIIKSISKNVNTFGFRAIFYICMDAITFNEQLSKAEAQKLSLINKELNNLFYLFDNLFLSNYRTMNYNEYSGMINVFAKAGLKKEENWKVITTEIKKNIQKIVTDKEITKINVIVTAYIHNEKYFDHKFYEEFILSIKKYLKINNICLLIYSYGLIGKGSSIFWTELENLFLSNLQENQPSHLMEHALIGFVNSPFSAHLSIDIWKKFEKYLKAYYTHVNKIKGLDDANYTNFKEIRGLDFNVIKSIHKISKMYYPIAQDELMKDYFYNLVKGRDFMEIINLYNYFNCYNIKLDAKFIDEVKEYLKNNNFSNIPDINYFVFNEFLVECMPKFENFIIDSLKSCDIINAIELVHIIYLRRILINPEFSLSINNHFIKILERGISVKELSRIVKEKFTKLYEANNLPHHELCAILYNDILKNHL